MSRVVVLGPYPPTADPGAAVVLAAVRALRAEGATVSVVSPTPSAAPAWGDPTRHSGARWVARAVRGADRVIWFAPDAARPAPMARRALARVATVERRPVAARPVAPSSWRDRVRRVRAGAPTYARTLLPGGPAWLRSGRR